MENQRPVTRRVFYTRLSFGFAVIGVSSPVLELFGPKCSSLNESKPAVLARCFKFTIMNKYSCLRRATTFGLHQSTHGALATE